MDSSHPRLAHPRPGNDLDPPRPPPLPTPAERLRELAARLTPAQWLGGLVALLVVLALAVLWFTSRSPAAPPIETHLPLATPAPATSTTVQQEVTVHVAGAVASPGLHVVGHGARVADAVAAAGGLMEGADLSRVNLAAVLADAQRVYIPSVGEAVPPEIQPSGGLGESSEALPLDINSADRQLLETLPGVGPATAEAIVEFREQVGRFTTIDGLLDVPGIGPAKLENLRGRVRIG